MKLASYRWASKAEINIIQLVTVLINSTDRLQQPYIRTQLAIATVEINIIQLVTDGRPQLACTEQLAIATEREYCIREIIKRLTSKNDAKIRSVTERMNLERLELIYCNINEQGKTINNTTKVITTTEHSKTYELIKNITKKKESKKVYRRKYRYNNAKGNSVVHSLLMNRKRIKRERSCLLYTSPSPRDS